MRETLEVHTPLLPLPSTYRDTWEDQVQGQLVSGNIEFLVKLVFGEGLESLEKRGDQRH